MIANVETYYLWPPVLVAFVSILVVWLCMRKWRQEQHMASSDEDKSWTQHIKANFNPDALSRCDSTQLTADGQTVNHGMNGSEECESNNTNLNERKLEKRIQQEQLKEIFKLMEGNQEKYGISSMKDIEEQMKRYKM